MNKIAAVTICSINYIAKALVLVDSYREHHPDHSFYLVLVDRKCEIDIGRPGVQVIWVEDLPIPGLRKHAMAFDVIEFNTNVKPTALLHLLETHEGALYLDPDMKIYAPLAPVFASLDDGASVVVVPHSNTPVLDGKKPDDLELLKFGGFNLGFVAVSACDEGQAFLHWWSERCLQHGFYEPQLGLAVDQKWVILAPCYFPNTAIVHDVGLNVAFWNLHERKLSNVAGTWMVNGSTPLRFIHFSSFDPNAPDTVANKQTRFAPGSRPDFALLARAYAAELLANASNTYASRPYGFDYFDDGTYVTPALRRFYAGLRNDVFKEVENPFAAESPVLKFARRNGLLVKGNARSKRHIFRDMGAYSLPMKIIFKMLRVALFLVGPERYFNLMRYLAHVSSLRNQVEMFGKIK